MPRFACGTWILVTSERAKESDRRTAPTGRLSEVFITIASPCDTSFPLSAHLRGRLKQTVSGAYRRVCRHRDGNPIRSIKYNNALLHTGLSRDFAGLQWCRTVIHRRSMVRPLHARQSGG